MRGFVRCCRSDAGGRIDAIGASICESAAWCRRSCSASCRATSSSRDLPYGRWHDLNDRRKACRRAAGFRVRISLRYFGLIILDRDARRKRHRVLVVLADVEFVRRRRVVHELALLLERCAVIDDDVDKRRRGSEDVISLAASRGIGGEEL